MFLGVRTNLEESKQRFETNWSNIKHFDTLIKVKSPEFPIEGTSAHA